MKRVKHYKPNVVYGLLLEEKNYYIGCHTRDIAYLTDNGILDTSGNYLAQAQRKHLISRNEYLNNSQILFVEEFDTKQEALEREVELISEFKKEYGESCINIALGNMYGVSGTKRSEETRNKISDYHRGRKLSAFHRQRISESTKGKPKSDQMRSALSSSRKGLHWYNNGIRNVMAKSCPEGYKSGHFKMN